MSSYSLPDISTLASLSTIERTQVLDALFEPSTALHTLSLDHLRSTSFQSYNDLIASIGIHLLDFVESPSTSDTQWLDKILGARKCSPGGKLQSHH